MATDDYAPVGGSLRLKGSGGIVKKKTKKKKGGQPALNNVEERKGDDNSSIGDTAENHLVSPKSVKNEPDLTTTGSQRRDAKTEAERKFEETKRKRLDERLLKDAAKTHKERVDDFNKYLSNLSEHHDMPRIGPG